MSFAQERMWFVTRYDPGNPMYNVPGVQMVRADIDVDALERALTLAVRRHEGLRTVFRMVDGELQQVVLDPFPFRVEVIDVRSRIASHDDVVRLVQDESARPFDLETGPLMRATLLRVSDERFALVTTLHHIITDGWSSLLVGKETDQFYGDFLAGREPSRPEPKLRYADYAVWQRGWLAGDNLERQVAYWRGVLDGAPVLDLPTDRPRPAQQSFRGRSHGIGVSPELTKALRGVGRQESATLNMVILAGFAALLGKWAGQEDLVVGTILGNRNRPELEEIVGFFANTAALRLDLSRAPTFRDAVRVARGAVLGADAHQELPFEKLVEELRVERDPSRQPLFQAMYFHHTYVQQHETGEGGMEALTDARPLRDENPGGMIDVGTAKFDLTLLTIELETGGLAGTLEYATDLFDTATAERFARQLLVLLERACAAPDRPLAEIPLMDEAERRKVVRKWNATASDYPRRAAHRLFEEQAARAPEALALGLDGGGTLTYGELNARANRLARRLRVLGIGTESRVGISLERSAELIVAIVAVAKAGGAYVPLDPEYPAARLEYMRADAAAPVVIARESDSVGAWIGDARVLSLVDEREAIEAESAEDLDVEVDPEGLAYVLYTSGSTGLPKGTGVPHRAIVRLVRGQTFAHFGPDEVVLQMVPVAFDVSTFEIWGPLANGGCIAVYPAGVPEPRAVGDFVRRHGVTTAWLTSGLFHQAVDEGLAGFEGVRQLLAGGDVLSPAHVRRAMEILPNARLIDGYGPTEATTFTSCHEIRPEDLDGGAIPVGRPLANARHYVLDGGMRPLPVGVPGELYIGGDGLARGYLGRPALTAEKFVPDPFATVPGGRLYRTGDRVRWLEGGVMDFLGRLDGQVKVRGHRIELGEVEGVLCAHPEVGNAVAVVRGEGSGRRLVAYVTPAEVDRGAVRSHAAARLPEYMVPAAVVALDALPLTPNGKVDRRALPEPDFSLSDEEFVEPSTETEVMLAEIWSELLGIGRVSASHSFFLAGGHSLLAMRLATAVLERCDVDLPLRTVFETPRLRDLAARVDALRDEALAALLGEMDDDELAAMLEADDAAAD
jgi:amino acid adenylation domain-containing protein